MLPGRPCDAAALLAARSGTLIGADCSWRLTSSVYAEPANVSFAEWRGSRGRHAEVDRRLNARGKVPQGVVEEADGQSRGTEGARGSCANEEGFAGAASK